MQAGSFTWTVSFVFCSLSHFLTRCQRDFPSALCHFTVNSLYREPKQVLCISIIKDTLLPLFFPVNKEGRFIFIMYFLSLICSQHHLLVHASCCQKTLMSRSETIIKLPADSWEKELSQYARNLCDFKWCIHTWYVIYVTTWQRQKYQFAKCN